MLSSVTLRTVVHFGIELVQAGLTLLKIVFSTTLLLPYGTTTQFSIFITIYPTLNSFLEARHFADLPYFFPKITFNGFLNAGCSRNIVARFLFGVSKGKYNFSGIVIGALLNIGTKSSFWMYVFVRIDSSVTTRIFRRANIMCLQNTLSLYFMLSWQVQDGLAHTATV